MVLSVKEIQWMGERLAMYEPLHGESSEFLWSDKDYRWLFGGNQCLGSEQKIYDPVKKCYRKVSEINEPFYVYAFDGKKKCVARAERPFIKGRDWLYEYGLSNGESIICSAKHRVLSSSGKWSFISESPELFSPKKIKSNGIIEVTSADVKRFGYIWDFNVPKEHNYFAGGILNHNSGKSYANMTDLSLFAMGIHPERERRKNALIWACIESWEQVRDIIWEDYIKKIIPRWQIANIQWGQAKIPKKIFMKNGNVIEFKAFNQGRELFQGRGVDGIYCDEQCHRDFKGILDEMSARLMAKEGFMSWSMTPVLPQPDLEMRIADLPKTDGVFHFNLNKNRKSRGGYITDKRIDDLIDGWADEVQETRVKGWFGSYYGAVYKGFNRRVNVIKRVKIKKSWKKYRGFDFGFTNPFVCLWVAVDKDGNYYVYREYYRSREGIHRHIKNVKRMSGREKYLDGFADPENAEDRAELNKNGVKNKPAKNEVARGIEKVQEKLKVKKNGKPSLYVFENCRNTIREMGGYKYPKGTESRSPSDLPVGVNDHTCDALRYVIYSLEKPRKKGKIYG